jgi:hypothetical protein
MWFCWFLGSVYLQSRAAIAGGFDGTLDRAVDEQSLYAP